MMQKNTRTKSWPIVFLLAGIIVCLSLPQTSSAAENVQLQTSFTPKVLGASTTISFGFEVSSTTQSIPSPLASIHLQLPSGISYLTTTLGLAICQPAVLRDEGINGCSPNSVLGKGSVYVEVPFGPSAGFEKPQVTALMGPPAANGNLAVLFYVNGLAPVYAQLVFQGDLDFGPGPFDTSLNAILPLVPSVPNGPDVSILSLKASLGPQGLLYTKRVHGRTVFFKPRGVSLPLSCPRGGFRFTGTFSFLDGTSVKATDTISCPHSHSKVSKLTH
jgi:hypothetical protein